MSKLLTLGNKKVDTKLDCLNLQNVYADTHAAPVLSPGLISITVLRPCFV